MAEYSKLIITTAGQALIAKMMAGSSNIHFTKICASSAQYADDTELQGLTVLDNVEQSALISNVTCTNEVAIKVETAFTNVELTQGYYMRTLGLYAQDPIDGEILYAVTRETSGNCYMPAYNGVTVSGAYIQLVTTVGNAENVSLEVNPAAIATIGDIEELEETISELNLQISDLTETVSGLTSRVTEQAEEISTLTGELSDLQGYVGYNDEQIYGVDVDYKNKTFVRLAGAEGREAGKDFDSVPCFGGRRRCNLTDDGVVVAYLGDDAYTETGALTVAVNIGDTNYPVGTKVQVMVEQPKFWYKVVPVKLENFTVGTKSGKHIRRAKYYISPVEREGFKVHPAFIENGKVNDKIYISAYEGCIFDKSANKYLYEDEQVADFNADLLCSIAGAKPASGLTQNLTRANTRKLAQNRGPGWEQMYAAIQSMDILLMLVEYASFDMQRCIGRGNVNKTDDTKSSMTEKTGTSANLGNASGSEPNGNNINIVSYRGEENIWGNIWLWVDGMNLHNATASPYPGTLYVADHNFADDTGSGAYTDTGLLVFPYVSNTSYGYISAFAYSETADYLFIPSEIAGNSALPIGDYAWNYGGTGWKVAESGASWHDGSRAGASALDLHDVSANRSRHIGGRLVYIPSKKAVAA